MAIYLLKINIALMLLYGFYRLMMTRDTFFGYRRMALWGILLTSLMVPAMNLSPYFERSTAAVDMAHAYAVYVLPTVPVYAESVTFTWMDAIAWVYLTGVACFMAKLVWQLMSIVRLARRSPVMLIEGVAVHILLSNVGPFSFFRWVFLNPEKFSEDELHEVLVHEQTHMHQLHSLDVLVFELFTIFNWFNPFGYLVRREVCLNLEYLADEAVLDEGNARKPYQYHLLGLAYHPAKRELTNNFNVLPLKNRIKMMNKPRTQEIGKVKYLFFLPLAAGLLVVSNIEMIARTLSEKSPTIAKVSRQAERMLNTEVTTGQQLIDAEPVSALDETVAVTVDTVKTGAKKSKAENKVYEVVEVMPQYPGGNSAMMHYIASTMKYPVSAQESNKQGRVVVSFVVDADGTVCNAEVVRSIDSELDREALRVVNGMPKWTPGQQGGKPVNVRYVIPVNFRLEGIPSETKPNVLAAQVNGTALDEVYVVAYGRQITPDEMKKIDPSDIESINVLKGEKATEVYGDKAKNGAIVIEMKKK